ncbi:flagellar basal body protein [Piscinibacterium candidicorallinum]|uniref:Flagellar basal body protein n=1 Tax=Piscinibacterium candidicorallinum TaxID=1793872 RepID=A0ABV7HA33_9BURK
MSPLTAPAASTALSGLNAANLRMAASANNVANMNTPGYRRQGVEQAALPSGGVAATVTQASEPGVELTGEVVEQKMALYSFKANVLVLQTQDQMQRALLGSRVDERV